MGQPERVERPGLRLYTSDRGAAAPARATPGQNAYCTVLRALSLRAADRGPNYSLNATGHEGGIGERMRLYARGCVYSLFRTPDEARRRHTL